MIRFRGEELRPGSRIAVFANDALGNFVVCTPLLQMLRERWRPSALHFYGGARTAELQSASDLIDWHFAWCGERESAIADAIADQEPYDLVVNIESTREAMVAASLAARSGAMVCGPCAAPDGNGEFALAEDDRGRLQADPDWTAPDLADRYPFLSSGFICEIFCRLAYLEGPIPLYSVASEAPGREVPDVLIAASASLPEKLWPCDKWIDLLERARIEGMRVGLVGAQPASQLKFWKGAGEEQRWVDMGLVEDLRGKFTLPQVVGALAGCRAVVTLDNGILHLAVAAGTHVVGLYRHGIHRLWAPPTDKLNVLTPGEGRCVSEIDVDRVWEALSLAV